MSCSLGVDESGSSCLPCPPGNIQVERDQRGTRLPAGVTCVPCSPGSRPDPEAGRCIPCVHNPLLADHNVMPNCGCELQGGLCLPDSVDRETPQDYKIDYDTKVYKLIRVVSVEQSSQM